MASPPLHDHPAEADWERMHLMEREADEKRMAALQRDAERERLLWLSLPHNDHPTYYSDSDGEGAQQSDDPSPALDVAAAAAALESDPYLLYAAQSIDRDDPVASDLRHIPGPPGPAQRYPFHPLLAPEEEEQAHVAIAQKILHGHRTGNRGNKLKRKEGVRYASRGKLSHWNDAKVEKEINDSAKQRTKALQRASIRSLLDSAPQPSPSPEPVPRPLSGDWPEPEESNMRGSMDDIDDAHFRSGPSSERTASRRNGKARASGNHPSRSRVQPEQNGEDPSAVLQAALDNLSATTLRPASAPQNLTSTSLAPTLLRPVLTPLALLESDTLRHTFRNGHIGALSKTALDLIESESVVTRALGRCFAAMESGGMPGWGSYLEAEQRAQKRRRREEQQRPVARRANRSASRSGNGPQSAADAAPGEGGVSKMELVEPEAAAANGQADHGADAEAAHDPSSLSHLDPLGLAADGVTPLSELEMRARLGRRPTNASGTLGGGASSSSSTSLPLSDFGPALNQLEILFVTPGGIDIPLHHSPAPAETTPSGNGNGPSADSSGALGGEGGADPAGAGGAGPSQGANGDATAAAIGADGARTTPTAGAGPAPASRPAYTTHLDADQQRALVRAALECVYELAQDSREYVERLQEVREKLAHVKLDRARVWGAVRGWALCEVEDELDRRRMFREEQQQQQQQQQRQRQQEEELDEQGGSARGR